MPTNMENSAVAPELEKVRRSVFIPIPKYVKAVYYHIDYLTYAEYIMRNAGLEEAQAGIKIAGEISTTSDTQMTPL